jgi:hypothetical protein
MASSRKWFTTPALLLLFVFAIFVAALMVSKGKRRRTDSFSRSSARGHKQLPISDMVAIARDTPPLLFGPVPLHAPSITPDPPPTPVIINSRVPALQALARVLEEDWIADERASDSGDCLLASFLNRAPTGL